MRCSNCDADIYGGDYAYDFGFEDKFCPNCIVYSRNNPRVKCSDCGITFGDYEIVFIGGIPFCEKCIDKREFQVMEE